MSNDVFIDIAWVAAHIDDPKVRIVDARSTPHGAPGQNVGPTGRERYATEHLPGAVYLDYAEDLSDPSTPYATRVAPPELFTRVMERNGRQQLAAIASTNGTARLLRPYPGRTDRQVAHRQGRHDLFCCLEIFICH